MLGMETDVTKQLTQHSAGEADSDTGFELPVVIVTAGCDSIQLFARLTKGDDLLMAGRVVATGRSSMEVFLEVDALASQKRIRVLEANFTMVARGSDGRAAIGSRLLSALSIRCESDDRLGVSSNSYSDDAGGARFKHGRAAQPRAAENARARIS